MCLERLEVLFAITSVPLEGGCGRTDCEYNALSLSSASCLAAPFPPGAAEPHHASQDEVGMLTQTKSTLTQKTEMN